MKNIFLVFAAILFAAVCNARGGQLPKKFEYTDSIAVPGIGKEVLFNRASMWVHETFKQEDLKIKIQDKQSGVIFGEITINDREHEYTATFSLTLDVSNGNCFFEFNNYTNFAGNLNNNNPDCCLPGRKWNAVKVWANTRTNQLITGLKDKMKSKSPSEDFLTVPLVDTTSAVAQGKNAAVQLRSQPVRFYIEGGGAYAPGIFNSGKGLGTGYHHGGNTSTGEAATPEPITMVHIMAGIFIPSRMDPFHGFGIDAGYFSFPLRVKQPETSPVTGQQVDVTNTTTVSGVELYPHYTLLSRKQQKYQLCTSLGIDFSFTGASNINDMVGFKLQSGLGRNGFFLSAFTDFTFNNIYGSSSRQQQASTSIKPLFLGLNLAFYPGQNKWIRKVF